jgi:hypothetical protein
MVQKSLISSRSYQPGVMRTGIFTSAFRTQRLREATHVNRFAKEILASQKIIED